MNKINYNKNPDFESAELSISSKNLKCERVANYLKKAGIMSSITSNQSIICYNKNNCYFENGCRILKISVIQGTIHILCNQERWLGGVGQMIML